MAITARIARILIVSTGILALTAVAAQASPLGVDHPNPSSAGSSGYAPGYHGFYVPQGQASNQIAYAPGYHGFYVPPAQAATQPVGVMSPAVDPANAQQVPIVVTQAATESVKPAGSGFNWTAGLLGAGIATFVLLLAAATATRIGPRRVAHL